MEYKKNYDTAQKGLYKTYAVGTSDPIIIYGWSPMSVTLTPTGTAKVQYTQSGTAAIDAGTATWSDWPAGDVTAETSDVILYPVTAIRVIVTSETAEIYIIGDE